MSILTPFAIGALIGAIQGAIFWGLKRGYARRRPVLGLLVNALLGFAVYGSLLWMLSTLVHLTGR